MVIQMLGTGKTNAVRLVALIIVLLLCHSANARDKKIFQKSVSDSQADAADTYFDVVPTAVNRNFSILRMRSSTGTSNERTIVLLDVLRLPNVGVKSATLALKVTTAARSTRTYHARLMTAFSRQGDATWNTRVTSKLWGASGGDFNRTPTASSLTTQLGTSVSWDITRDAQAWHNGTPIDGTRIKNNQENDIAGVFTVFASKEDPTAGNRPLPDVIFVQNVQNLTAPPSNGVVKPGRVRRNRDKIGFYRATT
jgi:hypothetical protein